MHVALGLGAQGGMRVCASCSRMAQIRVSLWDGIGTCGMYNPGALTPSEWWWWWGCAHPCPLMGSTAASFPRWHLRECNLLQ